MICTLCPRNCGAIRDEVRGGGFCGMPTVPVVAKAMLHRWEEPCLTGEYGAGAVFFSGCTLRCVYCQNAAISHPSPVRRETAEEVQTGQSAAGEPDGQTAAGEPGGTGRWKGEAYSPARLRVLFHRLLEQGAACLDLVTPSHFTPWIAEALAGEAWPVPVVWNCGGWEKVETLRMLEGKVQVYLPDMKYALPNPAAWSGAADYFETASRAIQEMFRQTGPCRMENGRLVRGVLIRHLQLPGELENTRQVMDWVSGTFRPGEVLFSLMSQYTPQPGAVGKLARRVTGGEYRAAVRYLENCGITDGYTQDPASARSAYTPVF